jgi:hypothetical protein
MHRCATRFDAAGGIEKCRRFKEFYDATGSWDRVERIIARVEAGPDGIDTRFIVTSFVGGSGRFIYEKTYCGRGQAENRIKECQLDLFADRTAAATMPANQVRLWFASFADVRLCALRRIGLAFSQFARASCGSIRPEFAVHRHGDDNALI